MNSSPTSYMRHRFSPQIITHAVWLFVRFNLSLREVEEMLLQRGIDVSYETVRRWVIKFGPQFARNLRQRQDRPSDVWHLDEIVLKIAGRKYWLWRAVDQHGVVLDELLQPKRDKRAAKRLLRSLTKRIGHTRASITAPKTAISHSESESGRCKGIDLQEVCSGS